MRILIQVSSLVFGLLLLFDGSQAATLQCYAKVNLIQGGQVKMVGADQDFPAAGQESQLQFALAGPVDCQVDVQLAALSSEAQWGDQVTGPGARVVCRHNDQGLARLNFGLDELGTDREFPTAQHHSRLVLSVTYE